MRYLHPTRLATMFALAGGLALAGCSDAGQTPLEMEQQVALMSASGAVASMYGDQLAELREATAPYHNFDMAYADGYDIEATPCWFYSGRGAMGYHYLNANLVDGVAELLAPELLVYEPRRNGSFRLVAMEYIVPIDAWTGDSPPSLLGQDFADNGAGLYILHLWLWRNNPNGMFADWNPKVSCEYAAVSEDRAP